MQIPSSRFSYGLNANPQFSGKGKRQTSDAVQTPPTQDDTLDLTSTPKHGKGRSQTPSLPDHGRAFPLNAKSTQHAKSAQPTPESPIEPVGDYIAEKLEGSELADYQAEVAKLDPTEQQAYELALSKVSPYDRNNYVMARKTYGNSDFIKMVFHENERKEKRAKNGQLDPLAYVLMGDVRRISAMMTGQRPKKPSVEEVWGSFQETSVDQAVQAMQQRRTTEFNAPFTHQELETIKRLETNYRLVIDRMYKQKAQTVADQSAISAIVKEASDHQLVLPTILNNVDTGIEQQRMLYRTTFKRKAEEGEKSKPAADAPSTTDGKKRRTKK